MTNANDAEEDDRRRLDLLDIHAEDDFSNHLSSIEGVVGDNRVR